MMGATAVFVLYTSAYFLSQFYRSANAVISADLSDQLALSAADLGLMTSVFFASFGLVQIPLGRALDRWGPRWVTSVSMSAGVVGSLIFGTGQSFFVLAFGRALLGIGMAGVMIGGFKAFSQWYPPARFATVASLLVGVGSSGALVAATPLAWLNEVIGWRAVFLNGAWVIAVIALFTRSAPPGVRWNTEGQLEGSLLGVIRDVRVWRISVHAFFMAGVLFAFWGLWAGPYLFGVFRLTEMEAGNALLLLGSGATVGFSCAGWFADRLGMGRVILASSAAFAACQLVLALQPPLMIALVGYALYGFSGGFVILLMAQARTLFPPTATGQVLAFVNLFAFLGQFVLQWTMGLIVEAFPGDVAGSYSAQGHTAALLFTGTCSLISLLWYFPVAREVSNAETLAA